jgi:hypothetical protein
MVVHETALKLGSQAAFQTSTMNMVAHARKQLRNAVPVAGYSEHPKEDGMRDVKCIVEGLPWY